MGDDFINDFTNNKIKKIKKISQQMMVPDDMDDDNKFSIGSRVGQNLNNFCEPLKRVFVQYNYNINNMVSVVFNDRPVQDTVDDEKQQCCICMQTNDASIHKLPCNHTFHTECIVK